MRNKLIIICLIVLTYSCDTSNCYWISIENDSRSGFIEPEQFPESVPLRMYHLL